LSTPTYTVNTEDERLTDIETEGKTAADNSDKAYQDIIDSADTFYNDQATAVENYGEEQKKAQEEQHEFTIDQIEQERGYAKQDYLKEQKGAYTDYKKQTNAYGANAEQMAAMGMAGTGYAESSQVSMFNQYQNRVAIAREAFVRADTEFANMIKDAEIKNSAALAQIAFDTLMKKYEISLAGFQYKNSLIIEKTKARREIEKDYDDRWWKMVSQIHSENSLAESARQHNEQQALNERAIALDEAKFAYQKEQAAKASSGGSGGSGGTIKKSSSKGSSSSSGSSGTVKNNNKAAVNKGDTGAKGNTTNKTNGPTVDMNSVLSLGYGPISATKLSQLVSSGRVIKYTDGNKIKFKKNPEIGLRIK
jgi:hypothetical protein